MIELKDDQLICTFPEVHSEARLTITFRRTLRVPDDSRIWPLPPALGRFPLVHVDDYAASLPKAWRLHGGVMLPMYQGEALWIDFGSSSIPAVQAPYPFAIQIATGKINAVSGLPWSDQFMAKPQSYVVAPGQPWLDGFRTDTGQVRQFVALPPGAGDTAEGKLTGAETVGGLQIAIRPMQRAFFEQRFPPVMREPQTTYRADTILYSIAAPDLGLAPGGRTHQKIYTDPYTFAEWHPTACSRCFVHLANSLSWQTITGQTPPIRPPTAREYTQAGLPWYDYYDDREALHGPCLLGRLKSIMARTRGRRKKPLPEDTSATPQVIVGYDARQVDVPRRDGWGV